MLKAYKFQLDLNVTQQTFFNKSFGCCRFIYNWALQKRIEAFEGYNIHLSYGKLAKMLTELKKQPEYSWLNEVSNECLQQSIRNMDTAYKNFFKYKSGFPKFKSRHNRQAIKNINRITVNLPGSKLKVQKSGWLKFFKDDREFKGKINSIVISRNTCNKYFASVLVETKKLMPRTSQVTEQSSIGIDVGIKDFCVLE